MLLHLVGMECGTAVGSPEEEEGSIQYGTGWCLRKAPPWAGNGVLDTVLSQELTVGPGWL